MAKEKTGTTPSLREQCRPTWQLAGFHRNLRFALSSGLELFTLHFAPQNFRFGRLRDLSIECIQIYVCGQHNDPFTGSGADICMEADQLTTYGLRKHFLKESDG